jgi:phage-related minor tail protein
MAVGVNIVSNFSGAGISKAIKEFKKLDGGAAKSAFALGTLDKSATAAVKGLAKVAAGVGVAAGVIGYKLASAAYESQKVMAQTTAIITATGGAAGVTAEQVSALSEKLSMQIGVDDELIQSSANLLLTFKAVQNQAGEGNDIFNRAVTVTQDMANVFGGADAAAKQLGKALADPVAGLTALKKSGIDFTEQQKQQIETLVKSGKSLEAQKIILEEIENQVGGTAAASATGFDRMKVAVGNVAETFGALLIPFIERFANFVINNVVPYMDKLAGIMGDKGIGGVVKTLAGDFLNMTTNMGKTGNIVMGIVTAFVALKAAMMAYAIAQGIATIAVTVFGVAWNATGIGLIAAAIAAIVVGLIALYIKFEAVRKAVSLLGDVLKFVILNAIVMVQNYFIGWINLAIKGINLLIKGANLFGAGLEELPELGYKAFVPLVISANNAKGAVLDVADALRQVKNEERRLEGKGATTTIPTGLGGGAAKTIKTLKELKAEYKDAVLALNDAQVKLGDATVGIADAQQKVIDSTNAVGDAFRGIGKAQQDVIKATRDHEKAQRAVSGAMSDAADAVLNTQKAQDKLAKSSMLVTKAQLAFDEAVRGYGANSKQGRKASDQLGESQRELETSGYDLEEAQFALIDAENELAAVRANSESTQRDIRQAEIDLATAKLDVVEAQRQQRIAQDELSTSTDNYDQMLNGVKADSEIYKELLEKLNEAKAAEQEAIDAVTEARKAEAEATVAISEALLAEQEALNAIEDAKLAVAKAIRDHEKALYDEAAAIRDVAKAQLEEAKAIDAVAEAQRKLNEAKKVKGLTPAAIAKVDTAVAGVLAATGAVLAGVGTATATGATASTAGGSARALGLRGFEPYAFANGGIVTKAMLGLVGEAGPEAIIPLSRLNETSGTTINISVTAGMGTDGGAVGNAVVDALVKYQRRNGAIPIAVKG